MGGELCCHQFLRVKLLHLSLIRKQIERKVEENQKVFTWKHEGSSNRGKVKAIQLFLEKDTLFHCFICKNEREKYNNKQISLMLFLSDSRTSAPAPPSHNSPSSIPYCPHIHWAALAGMSWLLGMTPSSSQLCCREGTTARSYNYIGARHLMCRKQSDESEAKANDGGGKKSSPSVRKGSQGVIWNQ